MFKEVWVVHAVTTFHTKNSKYTLLRCGQKFHPISQYWSQIKFVGTVRDMQNFSFNINQLMQNIFGSHSFIVFRYDRGKKC